MASSLEGITALDLGTGPAAALATMFLSDHGARVIRLVDPSAAKMRDGGFIVWDRGKECVKLDLNEAAAGRNSDTSEAAKLYRRLIAGADILVDDFAPSVAGQSLVEPIWLKNLNPRLISCSITGFGKRGPLKNEPPIDDLVLARMGVLGGMPGFRSAPVHVVHPLPSVGGALMACLGIASSLLARETTGRGRAVETTLMAGALLYHPKVLGDHIPKHVFQTDPSGSAPFYSVYQCSDGKYVQLGCVHVRFIAIAASLMEIGDLIQEDRFDLGRGGVTPEDDTELRETLTRIIATKTQAEWSAEFETADVPFAPARVTEEGMQDPQVLHNKMVVSLDDPVLGRVDQMGVPIQMSGTPGRVKGPRTHIDNAVSGLPTDYPEPQSNEPPPTTDPDPLPLTGIRVLEITNLIAGPTGGRLLADLGADVIKLEPLTGDLSRPIGRTYFYNINFNKRSISIDTSTDAGKQVVQKVAATADALLANLRPHATERMGIGAAINPNLIETHLTGYGWTGPYSKRPGIDPLAQALMGMERAQGGPDNPPVFPAQLAPTDYTNGAMGALGTILAIFARARTGIVQRVDGNLLNSAVVLSSPWFTRYDGKPKRPLADRDQYGLNPYHRLYRLKDGWIYVVARNDAEQAELRNVAAISAPAMEGNDGHPNETPFARAMAIAFADRSLTDTLATLKKVGVPALEAQSGDSEYFLDDPHAQANDMVITHQHPKAGTLRLARQYIRFIDTDLPEGRVTPLLGEHNEAVLREVGYSEEDIRVLNADGVLKTETV
jgi:crotonobetainyl-CoA:carnitine CoA-transferase CaiB-like acyl-CoA transferase